MVEGGEYGVSASGRQFQDLRVGRSAQALIAVMAVALALRMFAGVVMQRIVDRSSHASRVPVSRCRILLGAGPGSSSGSTV